MHPDQDERHPQIAEAGGCEELIRCTVPGYLLDLSPGIVLERLGL